MTHFDAIVIGAGPAGSSAAILLASQGWRVALIEKERFPRRKVCGECIAASNLPLLAALGIGPAVEREAGACLTELEVVGQTNAIRAALPRADHAAFPFGRALGRERLDTLLLERAIALGVAVWQPVSLETIEAVAGGVRCTLSAMTEGHPVVLTAPLAIAAHGSWLPLPSERAARRSRRRPSDLFAFKANYRQTTLAPERLLVLSFPGGYGGMVVADDGMATLAGCIREDRLARLRAAEPGRSAGEVVIRYICTQCPSVATALQSATREGGWLAVGPIAPGVHTPVDGGDVFMIGNAAGEAHPIIGEGMSMALQSAWLLCEALVATPDVRDASPAGDAVRRRLRRSLARQWRSHFASRLRLAALLAHVAMRPWLSRPAAPLLVRFPGLLAWAARWAGKTRSAVSAPLIARLQTEAAPADPKAEPVALVG